MSLLVDLLHIASSTYKYSRNRDIHSVKLLEYPATNQIYICVIPFFPLENRAMQYLHISLLQNSGLEIEHLSPFHPYLALTQHWTRHGTLD